MTEAARRCFVTGLVKSSQDWSRRVIRLRVSQARKSPVAEAARAAEPGADMAEYPVAGPEAQAEQVGRAEAKAGRAEAKAGRAVREEQAEARGERAARGAPRAVAADVQSIRITQTTTRTR
jgi:hypothetical protein